MNTVKLQDIKSIYKNLVFEYSANKLYEREMKKTIPFNIVTKKNKTPRNKLKEVKDLFTEKHKTLMKDIEDDTNKWKNILYSWFGRITLLKYPYYLRQPTDSM